MKTLVKICRPIAIAYAVVSIVLGLWSHNWISVGLDTAILIALI